MRTSVGQRRHHEERLVVFLLLERLCWPRRRRLGAAVRQERLVDTFTMGGGGRLVAAPSEVHPCAQPRLRRGRAFESSAPDG